MSCRYQIRMFESLEKDGLTAVGTVVAPLAQTFSVYAYSADEAETSLRKDIEKGKLSRGKVYQICPVLLNGELIRSFSAALDGSFGRIFMDPVNGPYCELRRIRLPKPATSVQAAED